MKIKRKFYYSNRKSDIYIYIIIITHTHIYIYVCVCTDLYSLVAHANDMENHFLWSGRYGYWHWADIQWEKQNNVMLCLYFYFKLVYSTHLTLSFGFHTCITPIKINQGMHENKIHSWCKNWPAGEQHRHILLLCAGIYGISTYAMIQCYSNCHKILK